MSTCTLSCLAYMLFYCMPWFLACKGWWLTSAQHTYIPDWLVCSTQGLTHVYHTKSDSHASYYCAANEICLHTVHEYVSRAAHKVSCSSAKNNYYLTSYPINCRLFLDSNTTTANKSNNIYVRFFTLSTCYILVIFV